MKRKSAERRSDCIAFKDNLSDVSDGDESYEERIAKLEDELKQLDEKCHPEYLRLKRKVDVWYAEEKHRVQILNDYRLETINREYKKDVEACDRDCELEKRRIQDYLISLCEELKKRLEQDKRNIELTPSGDILDFKPAVTRKLRRRGAGGGGGGPGIELASSNCQTNFMYWNDSLYGSLWPLVPGSLSLPAVCSAGETFSADMKSPAATENAADAAESSTLEQNVDVSSKSTCRGATECNETTTKGAASSAKGNLFGSLGLSMFGGSLLSHLLASVNVSSGATTGNLAGLGCLTGSVIGTSAYLSGSNAPNLLAVTSASSAVAVGLIGPQAGSLVAPPLPLHPPQVVKKRRQQNVPPSAQLNLLLPENDIYADLTVIHRACSKAASGASDSAQSITSGSARKHSYAGSGNTAPSGFHAHPNSSSNSALPKSPTHFGGSSVDGENPPHQVAGSAGSFSPSTKFSGREVGGSGGGAVSVLGSPTTSPPGTPSASAPVFASPSGSMYSTPTGTASTGLAVWIDDGRLYCGQKCFQTGASVILEGREGSNQRYPGTIAAVGAQDVAIRRSSDHGICRVTVQQLKQGRYALWLNTKPV